MPHSSLYRTITNLIVAQVAVIMAVVGAVLLLISCYLPSNWNQFVAFLSQLGGLLVATGLVTFLWDQFGRRKFAAEVMEISKLGADLARSGIKQVSTGGYLEDLDWNELFKDVDKLDIVVAYARTWRQANHTSLLRVARRSHARIRVFLPDPDDQATMDNLAARFGKPVGELKSVVREAIVDFSELRQDGGAKVEVYVRPGDSLFSCYRFGDRRAVITMYSHSKRRQPLVPAFVVDGEGSYFEFIKDEIKAIAEQSHPAAIPGGSE